MQDMLNALHIINDLHVTPLVDVKSPAFAEHYYDGLRWSLYGDYKGDKPFLDTHLVVNFKQDAAKGYFDGQHENNLLYVGFYLGALHGCLLSETGTVRSDVHALATFTHPDAAIGYYVGRRDCFMDTSPNERIYTDGELLEELRQIAQDVMGYPDEENSWYYSIGCVLGNLSVQVFPATPEEHQQWQAEYRRWQEEYEQELAKARNVEPVAPAALEEEQ
jgi:hypothetical protein